MKPLNEVIQTKEELEKKLIKNPKVTGIDIIAEDKEESDPGKKYEIRITVNDPQTGYKELRIQKEYKNVPVVIEHRKIELH